VSRRFFDLTDCTTRKSTADEKRGSLSFTITNHGAIGNTTDLTDFLIDFASIGF